MTPALVTALLHRTLLLGGSWTVLTAADPEGMALGVAVVPAAVWLSLRLLPARQPLNLWFLVLHLPRFLAGSVSGGIDVARRAFAPSLPLNPGWVSVPMDLSAGGRVVLGAELSLMPGTLAAGSDEDRLLIHLLDTKGGFDGAIKVERDQIAAIIGQDAAPSGRAGDRA